MTPFEPQVPPCPLTTSHKSAGGPPATSIRLSFSSGEKSDGLAIGRPEG